VLHILILARHLTLFFTKSYFDVFILMVSVVIYLGGLGTFFTSRTQQTKVGMTLSELINLLSGVIQGSSIGPVMLLMYIDGLAKLLEHHGLTAKLFAADAVAWIHV